MGGEAINTGATRRPRPWGVKRAAPFLSPSGEWPTSMTVNPQTQVGVYLGIDGEVMPIQASARGNHGSLDTTYLPKTTTGDGVPGGTDRTDTDSKQDTD